MIEIQNLQKSFGDTPVLKDVSITIPDGSIYGLVGVSGAGKSTLLRCINGLESYDSGKLIVNGVDVKGLKRSELNEFRAGIGMIFQQFSLLERKTVYQNVVLPMKCHGIEKEERDKRAKKLLELVGLSDKLNTKPRELSGGQKQRVAIARALTLNPSILLCDEATSALDPGITRSILELLKQINQELGITIIIVTHAMSVVKEVCDSVSLLEQGVVTYSGDVQDLFLRHPEAISNIVGSQHHLQTQDGFVSFDIIQETGDESLLSRIAIETGVQFQVVWGGLDEYRGSVAGSYVITVSAEQAPAIERFLNTDPNVKWRVIEPEEVAEDHGNNN